MSLLSPGNFLKPLIYVLLIGIPLTAAIAQDTEISGQVSAEEEGLLPGVNVLVKGTTVGTVTDINGNYSISVPSGQNTLVFSSIGFITQEVAINNQSTVNVELVPDIQSLSEVVVVGYGTQKRADVTGAVSSIKAEDINNIVTGNPTQALQGRTAGVRVEVNGGSPGASANVIIRGTGTLSSVNPLYVIDGVFSESMDFLNPADIESIEVLKDASAAAIYGARAGQGVVIITTKRGEQNQEVQIELNASYGWQQVYRQIGYTGARDYANFRNIANDNDGVPRAPANDAEFNPSIDSDVQDLSLSTAPVQNYGLRISGGGKNTTYSISANRLDQEGIVVASRFQRNALTVNTGLEKGRFKLSQSLILSNQVNNPNTDFGSEFGHIPTAPIFDETRDGGFAAGNTIFHGISRSTNFYGIALLKDAEETRDNILGSLNAEYEIIEGLTYNLRLSLDYQNGQDYLFTPTYNISNSDVGQNPVADLLDRRFTDISTIIENILTYERQFGDHNVSLLAAASQQQDRLETLEVEGQGFPNNNLRVISAANDIAGRSGETLPRRIRSVFGRINYSYQSKYLLSATIRRDGSSNFGPDNRFGVFPSVSLGWNLAQENFFNVSWVDNLKIRGSYGVLGSDNLDPFQFTPVLNINSSYTFGLSQTRASGVSQTAFANPDVRWEKTSTTNIGADIDLFAGKLSLTMDYFNKRSEDILVDLDINPTSGTNQPVIRNAATIDNRGFEFLASFRESFGDFKYNISGNFTILENEVVDLGEGVNPIRQGFFTDETFAATRTEAGRPVASFYGFLVDGIYQTQEEIDAEGLTGRDITPGDLKFRDLDGDGELTINDQTFIGSPIPDFEYGLNLSGSYKGFDLSLFFQGVSGNEIWNGRKFEGVFAQNGNKLAIVNNAWTPQNTNTDIPRPTSVDPGVNRRESEFYVEDGSYFRLRNASVGYTIPPTLLESIGLSRARVYLNMENVFVIDSYSGFFPEIGRNISRGGGLFNRGVDENTYPIPRTLIIGAQINF
ncbi:MAG: TonB-dependent receptor [Bacteroidota bacterium]